MRKGFLAISAAVMLLLAFAPAFAADDLQISTQFDESAVQKIEVGGRLLVDLHAWILLAVDKNNVVNNWFNAGYMWGDFGDFGFAGPRSQYPSLATVDGVRAVTFSGKNTLVGSPIVAKDKIDPAHTRGNLATLDFLKSDSSYAIEVWAYNPSIENGECLVSWGYGYLAYPASAPAGKWHYIVVVHSGGEDTLYVDGKKQSAGGAIVQKPASNPEITPVTLGCTADGKQSFSGSIAALRIHEKPITAEQIAKNFEGGIELGTVFLPNINAKTPDDINFGKLDNPNYKQMFSKHFRITWDPTKDINGVMTDATARNMMIGYERVYSAYEQMGMHTPVVSCNKDMRGDGRKYKIPICIGWDNGAWGGFNGELGFGFPIHGPGVVHAHELGHATQGHQLGGLAGNWWETHTQWMCKDFDNMSLGSTWLTGDSGSEASRFNYNNAMIGNAMFFVSNGRDYYHCFHIFCQLGLEPELGPMFIAKLWNTNGWDAYPFKRAEELLPGKKDLLKQQWVKMARRNITWDYPDAMKNPPDVDYRMSRTILEPIPYKPGVYRCPKDMAPQQFGYVICPLKPSGPQVAVNLGGYIDAKRGSDWRACLVAVNSKNEARYGDIFGVGKSTMTLKPDEKELYLVVAATPTIMNIDMAGEGKSADYRSFEQSQFPFTVKMDGCKPNDIFVPAKPKVAGKPHPNGGGFVAATAKVDKTAYVGPNAQVLGTAKVLGNARVEDYAVVKDTAVVRDHAVVSGHAMVSGSAQVSDWAKIRDFGNTTSAVSDFAKVAEHGVNGGKMSEYSTAKGCCATFGTNYGTSIVDGMYAKGNEVSKGIWMTWSWGQGKNAGELDQDLGGIYAQYKFDDVHAYLARDTYGVTHGYLVGKPKVEDGILTLNGKDQFVELPKDIVDQHDMTLVFKVKWNGIDKDRKNMQVLFSAGSDKGGYMFLYPSSPELTFVMTNGGAIESKTQLPVGKMVEVKVVLAGNTGSLYLDGKLVGQNNKMTARPEDLKAKWCYLGRDSEGLFFNGQIDEFTAYSIPLISKEPPYPSPAQWHVAPVAYSDSSVTMYAKVGVAPKPGIEYMFTETTGKGHSSKWQYSPVYVDKGLKAGETYSYTVKMRDAGGNVTKASEPASAKYNPSPYYVADKTPAGDPLFVMEAEHYQNYVKGKTHEWIPEDLLLGYRGQGTMYSGPEDGPAIGDFMKDSPRLDYRFKVDQPGTYYIWTRGIGRWWMSNSIYFAVDGDAPQKAYYSWENLTYRWRHISNMDSRKALVPIKIDAPGVHTLSVWMCEDGGSIDSFILTTADYEKYQPTDQLDINKDLIGKGPKESIIEKDGKLVQAAKNLEKPEWSSLQPVAVGADRVIMQAKNYKDWAENAEYLFEQVNGKSSGWQKEPYYEVKDSAAAGSQFRFKTKLDGKESDWSDPVKTTWTTSKAITEPADGTTVIEAEHFTANVPSADGHKWVLAKPGDIASKISGDGYMKTNVKTGMPYMGKTVDTKARLDYQVNFTKTGPHYIWVRGYGEYRFNHTLFVGLDMSPGDWGKVEMGWETMSWMHSKPVNIEQPGVHTVNVWLNHDAIMIDKIIVTTDPNYKPSKEADSSDGSPTGIGPIETK